VLADELGPLDGGSAAQHTAGDADRPHIARVSCPGWIDRRATQPLSPPPILTAGGSGELEDEATRVATDARVVGFQILPEISVEAQPPERRGGEQQLIRPLPPDPLEVGDRLAAVGRMVARVDTNRGLGKMPPPPRPQLEQ